MSPELTFRQKLIRVSCSAAICGLSVSFILGEAVDSHARTLHQWVSDPSLLPADYLPLRPVTEALNQIDNPRWTANLIAINDINSPAAPADLGLPTPAMPMLAQQTIYMEPALVSVSAAPGLSEHPRARLATAETEELPAAEVEKILVSIHEATAKLTAPSGKAHAAAPLAQSKDVNQGTAPKGAIPATVPPVATSTAPAHAPTPVPTLLASAELGEPAPRALRSAERAWPIQGKIWGATAQSFGAGHFEVGLFAKIDPDGKPVGYPLPQEILSAGQTSFRLEVPARVGRGYLFAEFVAAKTGKRTLISPAVNPWERGSRRLADLYFHPEDVIMTAAAAPSLRDIARDEWRVQGTIGTMFATSPIPQADAVVKVRGRKEATRSDSHGNFSLELPRLKGTLYLEVIKGGYHPVIVAVNAGDEHSLQIEIASQHALEQIAQHLGSSQASSQGIFLGQAQSADGGALRGLTASLSLKAEGPFYFDEEGNPSRDLKATGSNGRFLFLNVESGTGYLETALNGETIAPVQISSVEGGELIQKTLSPVSGGLHGRLFNPVAQGGRMQPVTGARVRVDGASDWVTSDAYGAFSIGPLKWFKGEKISLEMSADKFNNHRYLVSADPDASGLNLYAFPAAYISHLAHTMDLDIDPYAGLVIGKVSGPALRIDALADQATVNNAKDFYFDAKGRLRGSHEMTDPRFGTYIIFNVPKGRTILQGNDSGGVLRYSNAVFASPASINIEME